MQDLVIFIWCTYLSFRRSAENTLDSEPWVCAANIQGEMSLRCFVLRFRDSEPSVALTSVCFFAFSHRNTFYFCCRKNRRVRVLTIHKIKITKCKTWLFLFGAPPRVFDALRRILSTQNPGPLHTANGGILPCEEQYRFTLLFKEHSVQI